MMFLLIPSAIYYYAVIWCFYCCLFLWYFLLSLTLFGAELVVQVGVTENKSRTAQRLWLCVCIYAYARRFLASKNHWICCIQICWAYGWNGFRFQENFQADERAKKKSTKQKQTNMHIYYFVVWPCIWLLPLPDAFCNVCYYLYYINVL